MKKLTALLLALALLLLSALPVFAANITTSEYWSEVANELIQKNEIKDDTELARQLSSVAGGSITKVNGVSGYTVVIYASNGSAAYAAGKAVTSTANGLYDASNYSAEGVSLTDVYYANGEPAGVTIKIHSSADAISLGRVSSSVSSGLLTQAGVEADTAGALGLISGAMGIINTALGFIVIIISIGMTVFSALDALYLSFPAFKQLIDNQIESGGKGTKVGKNGQTASRWVTDDAIWAAAQATEAGVSPWGMYLLRRSGSYFFLSIVLLILLTGNIFKLTSLVTDILQGLFTALGL